MLSCKYSARAFLVIGFALGCEKYFCEVRVDLKGVGFSEIDFLFVFVAFQCKLVMEPHCYMCCFIAIAMSTSSRTVSAQVFRRLSRLNLLKSSEARKTRSNCCKNLLYFRIKSMQSNTACEHVDGAGTFHAVPKLFH